jgi:hypothetical protein
MTNKKNKIITPKITSFFKPIVSPKSATQRVDSNPVQATLVQSKVLTDSTNTPPKKKKAKSVHKSVNPVVIEINSSPLVRRLSPNHSPLSVTC